MIKPFEICVTLIALTMIVDGCGSNVAIPPLSKAEPQISEQITILSDFRSPQQQATVDASLDFMIDIGPQSDDDTTAEVVRSALRLVDFDHGVIGVCKLGNLLLSCVSSHHAIYFIPPYAASLPRSYDSPKGMVPRLTMVPCDLVTDSRERIKEWSEIADARAMFDCTEASACQAIRRWHHDDIHGLSVCNINILDASDIGPSPPFQCSVIVASKNETFRRCSALVGYEAPLAHQMALPDRETWRLCGNKSFSLTSILISTESALAKLGFKTTRKDANGSVRGRTTKHESKVLIGKWEDMQADVIVDHDMHKRFGSQCRDFEIGVFGWVSMRASSHDGDYKMLSQSEAQAYRARIASDTNADLVRTLCARETLTHVDSHTEQCSMR
jgi:hypothetical protein